MSITYIAESTERVPVGLVQSIIEWCEKELFYTPEVMSFDLMVDPTKGFKAYYHVRAKLRSADDCRELKNAFAAMRRSPPID